MQRDRARHVGKGRVRCTIGGEQPQIDAARPGPGVMQTMFCELGRQSRRRDQHMAGGAVKTFEHAPEWPRRQASSRRDIIGKARVERRGKGHAIRQTPTARQPAERAFGGDMDGIGIEPGDLCSDRAPRRHCQPDFGVAWHRHRKEAVGGDRLHPVPARRGDVGDGGQRPHHAIDLRAPGVADKGNAHQAVSSTGKRLTGTGALAAACNALVRAAQSRISMRPSKCSTSAVQLSTQSPSFM